MLTVLMFLAFISWGSALGAVFFRKKYEHTLLLTVTFTVFLIFSAGLLGSLRKGIHAAYGIGAAGYIVSAVWLVRKRKIREFCRCFFTPGFFYYVLSTLLIAMCLRGKLFNVWDEFSHWGDIVKMTTTMNVFSTSPRSNSFFQSYPPGMVLFQYAVEKLNKMLTGVEFSEWLTYVAFYMLVTAFILPVFSHMQKVLSWRWLVSGCCMLLGPLPFFKMYDSLYIDPALSLVACGGFYTVFTYRKNDELYIPKLMAVAAMLVLLKDAGMVLAFAVAAGGLIVYWNDRDWGKEKRAWTRLLIPTAAVVLAGVLPRILWNANIALNHASRSFSGQYDVENFLNVLLGRDTTYRSGVSFSFYKALTTTRLSIGNTGVSMNYIILFTALAGGLLKITSVIENRTDLLDRKVRKTASAAVIAMLVIYTVGTCASYMYKFSEYEAKTLASYSRYMSIAFCCAWMVILLLAVAYIGKTQSRKAVIALFSVMLVFSPLEYVYNFINHQQAEVSHANRLNFINAAAAVRNELPDDRSRIYIISEGNNGWDYWNLRYQSRPHLVNDNFTWSVGEEPFSDEKTEDIWTKIMTPEEWHEQVVKDFDYVLLYRLNDYFNENYRQFFEEESEELRVNKIYRVDKTTGMLIPIDEYVADWMNGLQGKNYTIFVAVKGDAAEQMPPEIQEALHKLGAEIDLSDKVNYSYYGVFHNSKALFEDCAEEELKLADFFDGGHSFEINSAGRNCGNHSFITIDGVQYSLNKYGLDIVVYDNVAECVIDRINVDTSVGEEIVVR